MMGNNTVLLVVTSSIASEFENLSGKVFEDGGEVMVVVVVDMF